MMLFLSNRIKFCKADGSEQPFNSGAPVVLVGFGSTAAARLEHCNIPGALLRVWEWRDHNAIVTHREVHQSSCLEYDDDRHEKSNRTYVMERGREP